VGVRSGRRRHVGDGDLRVGESGCLSRQSHRRGAGRRERTGSRDDVDTPAFVAPTKVHVFLPVGYDAAPKRRWPVTYFTAGTMNRYSAFREGLGGEQLTADYSSILVSPDANSGYWSDWFNGGAFGPPMYETWVIDQLIPLIDSRFRTLADRSHRAIFGISMGGYGAMMLAARHPDQFSAAATLSGTVDTNLPANGAVLSFSSTFDGGEQDAIYGPRITEEVRWRGHNPTDLASNLAGLDLQVRSANGTLNPTIGEGGDPNDALSCAVEAGVYAASLNLHQRLEELGIPHTWADYGAGCHSRPNFEREVRDTLAGFERVFADPPPAPTEFSYRTIEPTFDIRGWRVKADPKRALEFIEVAWTPGTLTLEGSGRTEVTSPRFYRGLKKVSVDGSVRKPAADGRVRFTVNLGPAHEIQQYRSGSATTFVIRRVKVEPHAVIRITKTTRRGRSVRVCALALGGSVRGTVKAGPAKRPVRLGAKPVCRSLPWSPEVRRVKISGTDGYGHPVSAGTRIG
jgi:S-formylglutathione hydrolase FrmB